MSKEYAPLTVRRSPASTVTPHHQTVTPPSPGSAAAVGDEQLDHGSSGERLGFTAGALPATEHHARARYEKPHRKSGGVWSESNLTFA